MFIMAKKNFVYKTQLYRAGRAYKPKKRVIKVSKDIYGKK